MQSDASNAPDEGAPLVAESAQAEISEPYHGEVLPAPDVTATIERIPDPNVREAVRGVIVAQSHIGPLPPANDLADYDRALPGLAREIVDNAKAEQDHRHYMDRRTGSQEFILNLVGLLAILVALAMMLAIVAYMVSQNAAVAGATLGTGIIVGVVVALTNYRKNTPSQMPQSTEVAKTEDEDK